MNTEKTKAGERTQWPILEANGTLLAIRDPNGKFSTNDNLIVGHGGSSLEEAEALVRLFAAAPELLEACKDALGEADSLLADSSNFSASFYREVFAPMLRAAIAKAEGR